MHAIPKQAAQAIRKVGRSGSRLRHVFPRGDLDLGLFMQPAGFDHAKGIRSSDRFEEYDDPQVEGRQGTVPMAWHDFMKKYFPDR